MIRHGRWQNSEPLNIRTTLPPLQKTREFADSTDDIDQLSGEKSHFFTAIRTIMIGWLLLALIGISYFLLSW